MQTRERRRQEKLRKDRLEWAITAFGLVYFAMLGTVLLVFAMGGNN